MYRLLCSWNRYDTCTTGLYVLILMLPSACTFGPSKKRGPPKGYIDAIEARLHQTEALIGILLASEDGRAQSLLQDMSRVRPCRPLYFFDA